jgi:hypothetical protein
VLDCHGTTVELQGAMSAAGLIRGSLVELGYRERLYRTGRLSTLLDIVAETEASLLDPVDADLPDSGQVRH